MAAFDFKKEDKGLYGPKAAPGIVDVPGMLFVMADGRGDPNTSESYRIALEILYGVSYAIKMRRDLPGGFRYVVAPLEGFWRLDDGGMFMGGAPIPDKDKLVWTALIRQPDFVTQAMFEAARDALAKKKPQLDVSRARLASCAEGLCVQAMHTGPYDAEPATVAAMDRFACEAGYAPDFSDVRRHHEIYLGDPRRTAPEKLKTVIRHPIRKAD